MGQGSEASVKGRPLGVRLALGAMIIGASALFSVVAIASGIEAKSDWWAPGSGKTLPALAVYGDPAGHVGILNANGPVDTKGHPFFEPLGPNGRACVSCHQPADGMSLSVKAIR